MVTIRLKGGMGNQMFQYAFGLSYSLKNNTSFQLDLRYLNDRTPRRGFVFREYDLDIFNIRPLFYRSEKYAFGLLPVYVSESIQKRLTSSAYIPFTGKYLERSFAFNESVFNVPDGSYFDGYFQCYRYFDQFKNTLLQHYTFAEPIADVALPLLQEIRECNSICLNVRRGDFVGNKLLGVQDPDYYENAVKYLGEQIENAKIYVFSDEIDWCRKNLRFTLPTVFVDDAYSGKKYRDKFELMINCRHFIIPNSSFGWWAAYLSQNPDKMVVAPKIWFNGAPERTHEIVLPSWIKL